MQDEGRHRHAQDAEAKEACYAATLLSSFKCVYVTESICAYVADVGSHVDSYVCVHIWQEAYL